MHRFKLFIGFVIVSVLSAAAWAVPKFINFQGSLSDGSGNLVTNPSLQMVFSIYVDPTTVTSLWSETQTVDVKNGNYNVKLGSVTSFPAGLFDNNDALYLGIKVGNDPEMTPRTEISSIPFAMKALQAAKADSSKHAARSDSSKHADRAKRSDTADVAYSVVPDSINSANIKDGSIQFIDIGQNGASSGHIMKWNGAAWSAANDEAGSGTFLPLAGGTMNGAVTNTGDPPITMGKGNFGTGNLNTGTHAFVAGSNNRAGGDYSVVGGGGGPLPSDSDSAIGYGATVSGGQNNTASGGGPPFYGGGYVTVGGGNSNTASGANTTVSGGGNNSASGLYATVSGGYSNTASDGGGGNGGASVGGGNINTASNQGATVGGGEKNTASGPFATVPGGYADTASGDYSFAVGENCVASGRNSFAAGQRARAKEDGAFVWADKSGPSFASTAPNQFLIRAANVGIGTASPTKKLEVAGSIKVGTNDTVFSSNLSSNSPLTLQAPAGTARMFISDATGNVGIGTTTPANKLDVEGGAVIGTTYSGANAAPANGLLVEGNVGIGTASPGASNLLELASTTKGLVLPRMTKTQRNAITSPVSGMMIYQTDNTPGLRVYNGTNWMRFTETAD